MFYQYEIKNNNLYLYLTMKYEFSKELAIMNDSDLGRRCRNFIQNNNIKFKGNKVFLVVDGIVVKTLDISNVNTTIINDNKYSCDNFLVNIKLEDNSLCEISLREYLTSLLFFQYSYTTSSEVLKSICILYNTYAYKMMNDNNFIDIHDIYGNYQPINYYRGIYDNYNYIRDLINSIINEVECIFITYNDTYILPFIHYSNSGFTNTNSKYPYLSSVKSLWDMVSPYYIGVVDILYEDINKIFNICIDNNSSINIVNKDKTKSIILGNSIYSLEEFVSAFNINSNDIYFIVYNSYLRVITKGLGNGYGLSIFGASEIAKCGGKYYNILKYYFPKAKLYKYIKELS